MEAGRRKAAETREAGPTEGSCGQPDPERSEGMRPKTLQKKIP